MRSEPPVSDAITTVLLFVRYRFHYTVHFVHILVRYIPVVWLRCRWAWLLFIPAHCPTPFYLCLSQFVERSYILRLHHRSRSCCVTLPSATVRAVIPFSYTLFLLFYCCGDPLPPGDFAIPTTWHDHPVRLFHEFTSYTFHSSDSVPLIVVVRTFPRPLFTFSFYLQYLYVCSGISGVPLRFTLVISRYAWVGTFCGGYFTHLPTCLPPYSVCSFVRCSGDPPFDYRLLFLPIFVHAFLTPITAFPTAYLVDTNSVHSIRSGRSTRVCVSHYTVHGTISHLPLLPPVYIPCTGACWIFCLHFTPFLPHYV